MDTSDDPFTAAPAAFSASQGSAAGIAAINAEARTNVIAGFFKKIATPGNITALLTGVQAFGILKGGAEAKRIAEQRAAIDRANAIAVRKASIERARIIAERGERFKKRQVAGFISGGVRTNVGVPLLVAAETRRDIASEIGFDLDVGRTEEGRFLTSARIEEDIGRFKKRKSIWDAIGLGTKRSLPFLGVPA